MTTVERDRVMRWVWLLAGLAVAAAAVAILVTTLSGGDDEGEIDFAAVERGILDAARDGLDDPQATVDCPDDVDWTVGGRFTCVATSQGEDHRLSIAIDGRQDDTGLYTLTFD